MTRAVPSRPRLTGPVWTAPRAVLPEVLPDRAAVLPGRPLADVCKCVCSRFRVARARWTLGARRMGERGGGRC